MPFNNIPKIQFLLNFCKLPFENILSACLLKRQLILLISQHGFFIFMRTKFLISGLLFLLLSCGQNPGRSAELVDKGVDLLYHSRNEEALAVFEKAIEYNPENFEAYYYKGNCLANKKKYQDAINAYDHAIQYNPKYALAFANRGNMKFYLGDEDGACQDWKRAYDMGMDNLSDKIKRCK